MAKAENQLDSLDITEKCHFLHSWDHQQSVIIFEGKITHLQILKNYKMFSIWIHNKSIPLTAILFGNVQQKAYYTLEFVYRYSKQLVF